MSSRSRSFRGTGSVQSPAASSESDEVSTQDRLLASLPTDSDVNLSTVRQPSTRAISSEVASNDDGDQMLRLRSRSNTLDSDPSRSRVDEASLCKNRKDFEQAKQVTRSSYIKTKSQSERPLKGTACLSLTHDNDIVTAPKKMDSQQRHKASTDAGPNASKNRKKQTVSSPGPTHTDMENKKVKSIGPSTSFKRQSSKSKIVDEVVSQHATSSISSPSLKVRRPSERMIHSTSVAVQGSRSDEVQYPSTPKTNHDDIFYEDGKQNNTPSSSNDSRGSALTDGSPENMSSARRRKIQCTPSSSSSNRDSPRIDDSLKDLALEKRTKAPSLKVAPQQSTPSTSSNRTDDSPLPSAETMTKVQPSPQQSAQSVSSSSRSSSRTEDIRFHSSDRREKESSDKLSTSNPILDDNGKTTGKSDVVRTHNTPPKDGDVVLIPRLKKEKSRGKIRNPEINSLQDVEVIVHSSVLEGKNHNAPARIRRKFVDSLAQDELGLASRNSDFKRKPAVSGEKESPRTDSNIKSGKSTSVPVDTKSFRRDGSARLNKKLEGSKISQNDNTVARSLPTKPSDGVHHTTQEIERIRSKKVVLKEVKSSHQREGTTTDQPMIISPSIMNVKGQSANPDVNQKSFNTSDSTSVPTTSLRRQATLAASSSGTSPPTRQSSGRSNSSGGQKRKSGSQRKLTVNHMAECGHLSSSGGSAQHGRLKETDKKQSDDVTVASDPSLPNDNEDFIKLQAAAASRKSLQFNNDTHSNDLSKSEQRAKTHERNDSLSKTAGTSTLGTYHIGRKDEGKEELFSSSRSSSRTLESNRSSHRRNEKANGQSRNGVAVGSTSRPVPVQAHVKSSAKSGAKNLNSIGNVVRTANGGGANRDSKPKDSTSLSSYLSDISVSTGADVTVASVQDSRHKELGPNAAKEKLKTSHLRRLVEPMNRRENVVRHSSHSSSALSSSGIRSSSSDQTETAADDRSISAEALFQSSSKTQKGSRFPQRNSSFYRPKLFDSLNGPLKGDSAPITPLRRLSMTGQYERQYSIASSSRCSVSYSGEESELEGGDLSYSERIEEENEEGGEESASSISYANSSVATMKPLDFDDLFTQFTWSKSQQDPNRIQKERQRLRDNIIETPLFRAMESSRQITQRTSQ
jgi:hypothetical protein